MLILTVLALEQQTPGWDEPGRGHLQSAPSGAGAKGPRGKVTEHQMPKPGLGLQVRTVSGLSYLSTFEVQCLVLRGLENIHCFLSKIFIHSVTTYCFYPQ